MDPKYIISHSGPIGSKSQADTAAAFFARKKQPASTSNGLASKASEVNHVSNFSGILGKCPPPAPSALLKRLQEEPQQQQPIATQHGKVRVVLRVANSGVLDPERPSNFRMDKKKRQVTLLDPSHSKDKKDSSVNVAAPKMFAFDGLYSDEDAQAEVASSALSEAISGVVSGVDGCLFAFGHASLGKTYTMIGSDESSATLGIIPSAIAWLFRSIKEAKNARFAIRVSALEIGGQNEEVRDLLTGQAASESDNDSPPSQFFPSPANSGASVMSGLTELRCSTAERAGYYLDAALTSRSTNMAADLNGGKDSHFVFTLHVYQYEASKKGLVGGRSRLHLIDFGCCDRTKTSGGSITLSGLGNVILGIFNGQRHLPFKESKVTQMLKDCMGSYTCQATMVAHVTPEPSHYSETLHTTQLASRIHRMRRKKASNKGGASNGSAGSGSSDDTKMNRLVKLASSSSEFTDPSSSEQSCDTVIFVGSRDDEGTDFEHPPVFIPSLNSGDSRGQMAKILRGSSAELKPSQPMKSSTLERNKRHSKSPSNSSGGGGLRNLCSPTHMLQQSQRLRPGSVGSTPTHSWKLLTRSNGVCCNSGGSLPRMPKGKMPLTGRVAGYRQQPQQMPQWPQYNDPNMAIYGYMDDQKISMIQQWVECQERHVVHQQQHQRAMSNKFEPEPFAWLNQPQQGELSNEAGLKVLTQFKTVESDDSFEEKEDESIQVVQIHHNTPEESIEPRRPSGASVGTPPISPCIIVPDEEDAEEKEDLECSIKTIDELYNHCEQLVETLSQASEELKNIGCQQQPPAASEADATKDDTEVKSHQSSEENLNVTVSSLDANKLHFLASRSSTGLLNEVKVCEDVVINDELFNKKFDQLAKLHELYQSVSSINDKAKSHLEEAKMRKDSEAVRSSCLSLSALMTDLEKISINSNNDINSLCSEPVRMTDFMHAPGHNGNNYEMDDLDDLFNNMMSNLGSNNNNKTVSLSDLEGKATRSDSPILEGIDSELAKYAKLKDLEQAYQPPISRINPDGASNPDLKVSNNGNVVQPPLRRSPGNGRSGSEAEDEFPDRRRLLHLKSSDGHSLSSSGGSTSTAPSKSSPSGCSSMSSSSGGPKRGHVVLHRPQAVKRNERTVLGKSQSTDTSSDLEIWQKHQPPPVIAEVIVLPPQQPASEAEVVIGKKVPKFSRLFKLSRSPLKVIRDGEKASKRSKSADSRSNGHQLANSVSNGKDKSSQKADKKATASTAAASLKQPKNAKGTSSSASNKKHTINLASPYSVKTAPKTTAPTASTASSGYDSNDNNHVSKKRWIRLRSSNNSHGGRGAANNQQCLAKEAAAFKRASQRKSSGYESSERDSVDSLKAAEDNNVHVISHRMEPLHVLNYESTFIERLDERWRLFEVKRLQHQQTGLKSDLTEAKARIGAKKWTFGLHVSDSVSKGHVASTDPSVIEALQKETEILSKRVNAAKSHAVLTTSFDVNSTEIVCCCTTECEAAEAMIMASDATTEETEIF